MSDGLVVLPPESERYRAELLLLHGLWVDSRVWRGVGAGFAHRGWTCLLAGPAPSSAESDAPSRLSRAEAAVRGREVPPVAVGHDAGALVALELAARGLVRAAVAIAPLLDGSAAVQPRIARLVHRLRADRAPVAPPDPGHPYFAHVADARRADLAGALGPETVGTLREVDRLASPARPAVPALLVASQDDPVSSPVLAEICARGIEADFLRVPRGGHWPMLDPRADDWITQVHRWLIRNAGQDLLVLRGDEDLVD